MNANLGPAIETTNLTRDFGQLRAVDQLNLRVEAGGFYGFLGPNGAGKSTTIKMLAGLVVSLTLLAVVAGAYWWSLVPLGKMLQRRETRILNVVTAEVE